MPDSHAALMIGVIALVTVLLRFLPFWCFGNGRKTPPFVSFLGKTLPYAAMGMLVVYCLKNTTLSSIPEIAASIVVVLLHIWKRNTPLSILGGTLVCVLLHIFL